MDVYLSDGARGNDLSFYKPLVFSANVDIGGMISAANDMADDMKGKISVKPQKSGSTSATSDKSKSPTTTSKSTADTQKWPVLRVALKGRLFKPAVFDIPIKVEERRDVHLSPSTGVNSNFLNKLPCDRVEYESRSTAASVSGTVVSSVPVCINDWVLRSACFLWSRDGKKIDFRTPEFVAAGNKPGNEAIFRSSNLLNRVETQAGKIEMKEGTESIITAKLGASLMGVNGRNADGSSLNTGMAIDGTETFSTSHCGRPVYESCNYVRDGACDGFQGNSKKRNRRTLSQGENNTSNSTSSISTSTAVDSSGKTSTLLDSNIITGSSVHKTYKEPIVILTARSSEDPYLFASKITNDTLDFGLGAGSGFLIAATLLIIALAVCIAPIYQCGMTCVEYCFEDRDGGSEDLESLRARFFGELSDTEVEEGMEFVALADENKPPDKSRLVINSIYDFAI